jgi:hypothetical protein
MKYTTDRLYSDPDKAARRLMQHAHAFEPVQDGRIYIEKLNGPFCSVTKRHRRNTRRASTAPLAWAGCNCTKAERS